MIKVSHMMLKRTSEKDAHLYMATLLGVYMWLLILVQQDFVSEHDCKDSVTRHFVDVGLGCLSCTMKSIASGHDSLFCYQWRSLHVSHRASAMSGVFLSASVPQGPYSQIGLHWSDKCFANVLKYVEWMEKCRWCMSGLVPKVFWIDTRVHLIHFSGSVWRDLASLWLPGSVASNSFLKYNF